MQKDVLVGVGCFVSYRDPDDKKTRVLVGQRIGSHGAGTWQLPGGHLDMFEEFNECAKREVFEETNLILPQDKIQFVTATNNIMLTEKKHYVTIFMWCEIDKTQSTQAKVMEPHKLSGEWEWLTIQEIQEKAPLFSPLEKCIQEYGLTFLE